MAYDIDNNVTISIADLISKQGRAWAGAIDDLVASTGISLNRTSRLDNTYGGSGWERKSYNDSQVLTQEQQDQNAAAISSLGPNARLEGKNTYTPEGKIAYKSSIVSDTGVKASITDEYKKIGFGPQLLNAAVMTGLSAAFAGAAGFGPLAGGGSGSFGSSALGKSIGTIGRGAVQGGVQSGISALIQGKDPIKAGVTGAFSGGLSSSLTPIFGTSALGRAATSGITSGVTAAATGGDPLSASLLGIVGQTGGVLGLDGSTAQFVNNLARITTQVELAKRKQKGG
jgi:hypothetical protein